ncbi:hypothetical protein GCM10018793_18120 [Streptomyces sulfonofaciens]|uniref:Nicotinate phosphoribosyltransferase N-terminal domain-containing protein n=1 Tax=Streptomyces sulfonofaciens TaxID=68272 RepID=A0A919FZD5_9ACTN|nr:hypothetical protein [Streptomyces sulfonofaciens]GHH75248.1 hypothetical protein GCM10018793_18120 [Streptomyces sulfonofaciens]
MSAAMMTDLYEVTMALAYLEEGRTAPATFDLFVRDLPPERGFLVSAGLGSSEDYLSRFRVGHEDVAAFAEVLHRPFGDMSSRCGEREPAAARAALLETAMVHGRREHAPFSLADARQRLAADRADLPDAARRIRGPHAPCAVPSEDLSNLTAEVRHRVESDNL